MGKSDEIDFDTIEKLAKLLSDSDLSEIEVEHESLRIRLSREIPSVHAVVQQPQTVVPASPAAPLHAAIPPASGGTTIDKSAQSGHTLTSPMVGTAYLAPEPDKPAFVSVGDTVKKGQTVLIVEAMKTMNHITADRDGIIGKVLVDDAQPVEYGEPLMIIE